MELYASHDHPSGYGGGPASFVGDYLGAKVVAFGLALQDIEVRICNDGPGVNRFWSGFEMPQRPSCRFLRKRGKLVVVWPGTRHGAAEVAELFLGRLTRDCFGRGAEELHDALAWAFAERLGPGDDFDGTACLNWVAGARDAQFTSDAALRAEVSRRGRIRQTRLRKAHLDAKAEIDWSRFHPAAAYLLPEPRYWSDTDDWAPHGNAVGQAILAGWDQFGGLDAEAAFAATGLPSWSAKGSTAERANAVRAHIALAVGHLKVSGTCPADIARAAMTCLKAEKSMPRSPWTRHSKGRRGSALDEILHILQPWCNGR